MSQARFSLDSHTSDVNSVSFSVNNILCTCAGDKTVRLWALPDFSELSSISPLLGHSLYVNYCDFSPCGALLASCSTDGKIIVWDLTSGRRQAVLEHPSRGGVRVCKFSPNSSFLVSCSDDETLCIWEIPSWRLLRNLKGHEAFVVTCAFSPDSHWMASGSSCGELRIWDMSLNFGNCPLKEQEVHDLGVTACDFSILYGNNGEPYEYGKYLLATCGQDSFVKLWNVLCNGVLSIKFTNRYVLAGHTAPVLSCCFTSNGKLLASGSVDKTVRLWNPLNGTALKIFEGHTRYVTCCAFSYDGAFLASGSNDKMVKIWQIDELIQPTAPIEPSTLVPSTQYPVASTSSLSVTSESKPSFESDWQKPVNRWNVDEVCCWIGHIGYSNYEDNFRQNVIDGSELLTLTQEALEKSLGIKAYGTRNKIIRARDFLAENTMTPGMSSKADFDYTPDEFLCPISREVMQDPVIAADGYTYERAAIESWIKSGNSRSPMTNAVLLSQNLTPNRNVKMLIQRHITS